MDLGTSPDNLDVDMETGDVWTGAHPSGHQFRKHMGNIQGINSPSHVLVLIIHLPIWLPASILKNIILGISLQFTVGQLEMCNLRTSLLPVESLNMKSVTEQFKAVTSGPPGSL